MLMLDICCGVGGASAAMVALGWDVLTLDIDPAFCPDIVADIRTWSYSGPTPDLIWCSPPCEEFSREFMPWSRTGVKPSLDLVLSCKRIISEVRPRYWIIENVRGAVRYLAPILGRKRANYGPFFLWGNFPDLGHVKLSMRKKESYSSSRPELRAAIPYALSDAVALAVEHQQKLL